MRDVLSFEAFGFTDELEDGDVEVDIEGSGVGFSDDEGGL